MSTGTVIFIFSVEIASQPPTALAPLMTSLSFPDGSLQQLVCLKLNHREYKFLPDILKPHVTQTVLASLLSRLRPQLSFPDRLTVTGEELDTRVYGQKRKFSAISRSEVKYDEFFD